jgi:hypothetical protein
MSLRQWHDDLRHDVLRKRRNLSFGALSVTDSNRDCNAHTDRDADEYTDQHGDIDTDRHSHEYTVKYTDRDPDEHANVDAH